MRRLKTVRRPPIYPKTPGHLPCSSLTHPLPLSSRRPSVSFGGFGLTTRDRGVPLHVGIDPPEGGLRERSFVKCDDVRSVDKERLVSRWGTVSSTTVEVVEDRIRILLEL